MNWRKSSARLDLYMWLRSLDHEFSMGNEAPNQPRLVHARKAC